MRYLALKSSIMIEIMIIQQINVGRRRWYARSSVVPMTPDIAQEPIPQISLDGH